MPPQDPFAQYAVTATAKTDDPFAAFVVKAEPTAPERSWLDTAKDVGVGALKGLGSTVAGVGEMAANAGMLPGVRPSAFDATTRHPAFKVAEDATTATNTPQRVGKAGEFVAELALPMLAGARAIPSTTRAAGRLQGVLTKAKHATVDVNAPGQVALRIQELAERGGTMPRMVGRFLQRTTDPTKGPMAYDEARDFYSNLSRLSGDEFNRLTGPIKREVGNMRTALNESLKGAADTVGMGDDYAKGMSEYARAAKMKDSLGAMGDQAKKALPIGLGTGAAGASYYAAKKLFELLSGQ